MYHHPALTLHYQSTYSILYHRCIDHLYCQSLPLEGKAHEDLEGSLFVLFTDDFLESKSVPDALQVLQQVPYEWMKQKCLPIQGTA